MARRLTVGDIEAMDAAMERAKANVEALTAAANENIDGGYWGLGNLFNKHVLGDPGASAATLAYAAQTEYYGFQSRYQKIVENGVSDGIESFMRDIAVSGRGSVVVTDLMSGIGLGQAITYTALESAKDVAKGAQAIGDAAIGGLKWLDGWGKYAIAGLAVAGIGFFIYLKAR